MVLCEQPLQMNAVLFHYGLTPIQFTACSCLKFCFGSRNACTANIRTMTAPFQFRIFSIYKAGFACYIFGKLCKSFEIRLTASSV